MIRAVEKTVASHRAPHAGLAEPATASSCQGPGWQASCAQEALATRRRPQFWPSNNLGRAVVGAAAAGPWTGSVSGLQPFSSSLQATRARGSGSRPRDEDSHAKTSSNHRSRRCRSGASAPRRSAHKPQGAGFTALAQRVRKARHRPPLTSPVNRLPPWLGHMGAGARVEQWFVLATPL